MDELNWTIYWWQRGLQGKDSWNEIALLCYGAAIATEYCGCGRVSSSYELLGDIASKYARQADIQDGPRGAAARTHARRAPDRRGI